MYVFIEVTQLICNNKDWFNEKKTHNSKLTRMIYDF